MELEDREMENVVDLAIQKMEYISAELQRRYNENRTNLAQEILNGEFEQLIDLPMCELGKKRINKAMRILRVLRG